MSMAFRNVSKSVPSLKTEHKYYTFLTVYSSVAGDGRLVRALDPCSKGPGFDASFRPVTKCEERISELSVIPGKKVKGIRRCGHIKRKD